MSTPDARYANPITIGGGPALVVGIPSGGRGSALNTSSVALAAAMTRMRQYAAEIRGHSQLLPSERSKRLAELQPQAVAAVRAHRRVLAAEKARIEALSKTASYVKPSASLPHHTLVEDQLLLTKFMGMSISERTQLTARVMADAPANLRWAECLLRAPRELTDIPAQMHNELRFAVLSAFDPEAVTAIQAQEEQVEMAQRALDLATQALAETLVGVVQELREEPEPEPAPEPDYRDFVSAEVIADLKAGPGLVRPSNVELAKRQA